MHHFVNQTEMTALNKTYTQPGILEKKIRNSGRYTAEKIKQ
jgi:hypothetical protein